MQVYLLIGLPGSGKSHWLKNKKGIIFDDMSQIENGMQKLKEHIQNSSNKQNIYISDVNFCEINTLEKAKEMITSFSAGKELNFKYILFISTEDISLNNVEYRQDGRNVKPTIKRFANKIEEMKEYLSIRYNQYVDFVTTPKMTKQTQKKMI